MSRNISTINNKSMQKSVVFYGKQDNENPNNSIEKQLKVCEQQATEFNYKIENYYIDVSASNLEEYLPQLHKLLNESSSGMFDLVITAIEPFIIVDLDEDEATTMDNYLENQGIELLIVTDYAQKNLQLPIPHTEIFTKKTAAFFYPFKSHQERELRDIACKKIAEERNLDVVTKYIEKIYP